MIFGDGECRANRKMSMKIPLLRMCMYENVLLRTVDDVAAAFAVTTANNETRELFRSHVLVKALSVATCELVSLSSAVNGIPKYVLVAVMFAQK